MIEGRLAGRLAAILALSGAVLLSAGTYLHPMSADPNLPREAFIEYAGSHHWVAIHLVQLLGAAFIIAALLLVSMAITIQPARALAVLVSSGLIASFTLVAALQAVDGIALKRTIEAWMRAPAAQKDAFFAGAFAVRQIEIGLASISSLVFGLTVAMFGLVLLVEQRMPQLLAVTAIFGGLPFAASGLVSAQSGFSASMMALNMPAGILLTLWTIWLGVHLWRKSSPRFPVE